MEKEDLTEHLTTILRIYNIEYSQELYDELVNILEMAFEQGYDQCDRDNDNL